MRVFIIGLLFLSSLTAQPLQKEMAVFESRREKLMAQMQPGAVAVFPSKPRYLRNLDVNYPYRQESNFYYLSGFEEPQSILLLIPHHSRYKYILFVEKVGQRTALYDGEGAGIEDAMTEFGADTAFYFEDFEREIHHYIGHDRTIYYTFGIHPELDEKMRKLFIERRASADYPIIDPHPLVAEMRLIKEEGDWRMGLQKAIDISVEAHREAIKATRPGMYEYEIQAVFEYVFRRMGSPRNGYPCIVGSGPNTGILHYHENTRQMQAGDLLLMDCGAEYGYYSADITRTIPVNGKFTKEQREIYQIVLNAQKAAIEAVRPGLHKVVLDSIIEDIMAEGLLKLGFIKEKSHFPLFTIHKYAHWIGLEVHDVGGYTRNGESIILEPGMVFTVEPGIYIRRDVLKRMKTRGYTEKEISAIEKRLEKYFDIGVRIEDDILVTETGYKNLSEGVPREIEEIENLMKSVAGLKE